MLSSLAAVIEASPLRRQDGKSLIRGTALWALKSASIDLGDSMFRV